MIRDETARPRGRAVHLSRKRTIQRRRKRKVPKVDERADIRRIGMREGYLFLYSD